MECVPAGASVFAQCVQRGRRIARDGRQEDYQVQVALVDELLGKEWYCVNYYPSGITNNNHFAVSLRW
jgi:hypothetical protein